MLYGGVLVPIYITNPDMEDGCPASLCSFTPLSKDGMSKLQPATVVLYPVPLLKNVLMGCSQLSLEL